MIQIKNAKELDGMRRANALRAAALKYGGEHIEAGMTTWELDKIIYDFIIKHGGKPNFKGLYGFPGTACISLNDTIIHGIPSHDQVIRPGDIVSIDTGAKIDGFNGDRLSRPTARTPVSRWCGSSWATAPAVSCTRTPKCPTMATQAAARVWCRA